MREKLIRDLQNAIEQNHTLLRELHAQQRKYIGRDLNIHPGHVFIGTVPCEESPTKTHVFDLTADPRKVGCVYCKGQ